MSTVFNSLIKRNDSSETFVSVDEVTTEKIETSTTGKNSTAAHLAEWGTQRNFLIALLRHIKEYDKELNLNSNDGIENKSTDSINHLRSKIKNSPEIYKINNWNDWLSNREKILNLLSLFEEKLNLRPPGNTAKYEALKIAISDICWEQISETIEIAETIPQIGNTWLAPILAILSKFPYHKLAVPEITSKHFYYINWTVNGIVSITRHIKPLRRNVLNDPIIPQDEKYRFFNITLRRKGFAKDLLYDGYKEARDIFFKDLTNDILIDEERWNSHLQNFILVGMEKLTYGENSIRFF